MRGAGQAVGGMDRRQGGRYGDGAHMAGDVMIARKSRKDADAAMTQVFAALQPKKPPWPPPRPVGLNIAA